MSERQVRLRRPESYRDTQVPVQRSVGHIESVLAQFGAEATSVAIARRGEEALAEVRFLYDRRSYSVKLDLGEDPRDHRQRMRMLFWLVKASLEAVLFGVVSAEEALLPYAEISAGGGGRTTVGRVLLGVGAEQLPRLTPDGLIATLRGLPAPARGGDRES